MIEEAHWDAGSVSEWMHDKLGYIKFMTRLFDDNDKLLLFTEDDWDDSWIEVGMPEPPDDDNDIPF